MVFEVGAAVQQSMAGDVHSTVFEESFREEEVRARGTIGPSVEVNIMAFSPFTFAIIIL